MNDQKEKKKNNGVSRFSGVKCLIENNDLISFETFVCAFLKTFILWLS